MEIAAGKALGNGTNIWTSADFELVGVIMSCIRYYEIDMEAQAEKPMAIATYVASAVLMVEPNTFGFDQETAETNAFQHKLGTAAATVTGRAMAEYDAVVEALTNFGVDVVTYAHDVLSCRPNAVFPNNWMTTWPDGRVYTYPMAHASRRSERMRGVLDEIRLRYRVDKVRDLTAFERRGQYLEGTGAIVFDHRNRIGYACRSARCDAGLFADHMRELEYDGILFEANGLDDSPVYHTNVMMGVEDATAVVCMEAIRDETQRNLLRHSLERTGHEVINITYAQLGHFCGNLIQLRNSSGSTAILMSEGARRHYRPEQLEILSRGNQVLAVPAPTIEAVGGGGVRCMVAEIFLPELH